VLNDVQAFVSALHVDDTDRFACPSCSPQRRKQNLKELVVTRKTDAWVFHCHHCGVNGSVPFEKRNYVERKLSVVPKPITAPVNALEEAHYAFLNKRGISRETADKTKLFAAEKWFQRIGRNAPAVGFPYFRNGAMTAAKYRCIEDKKFAFVWNAFELLSKAPFIVIATDNDSPGQALAEELARRIGKHKCRLTKFDRKDLNEVLLNDGSDAVRSIIDAAEPYPVEGLSSATKFSERVNDLWSKGTGKGVSTGYSSLDQIYTVAPGQLTVVTGYPSNGKSNFVDQLMVNLARQHDWKFAVCSFENQPEVHITRFMEIYSGKRFFEGSNRMTDEEKDAAFKWVTDHFLFMDSETVEPATIESILDRAQAAVARMGIRGLCIDPYNYIDMKNRGDSETGAISDLLTRVQAFAKAFGVHVWFVAHPSKVSRTGVDLPRPDGMSIAGSMAWWAKADCGLTVHRAEIGVEVAVWKCRYRWVGTQGEVLLGYDKVTGTYNEQVDVF